MSWWRATKPVGFSQRWSTYLLPAAGILFLAQLIPVIGIYLMFLLAALWTYCLVVAFLVAIAWEALTGQIARAWLALPIAALLSYYGVVVAQRLDLAQISSRWAAANASTVAAFDSSTETALFNYGAAMMNDQHDVAATMHASELPVAFLDNSGWGGSEYTRLSYPKDGRCPDGGELRAIRFVAFNSSNSTELCLDASVSRPSGRVVAVERAESTDPWWDSYIRVTTTTAVSGNQVLGTFREGLARALPLLPVGWIGCTFTSQPAAVHCGASFSSDYVDLQSRPRGSENRDPASIVLGLQPRTN
jgi:hypothetical protein